MIDPAAVPVNRVLWDPCYRLIASRFAPVGVFDRVSDTPMLERVLAIEGITNDRLQDEIGEIQLVPPDERLFGPGSTPIMAAFTHRNPLGSRFSRGDYGVYYCGHNQQTAIAEVGHHQAIFLRQTNESEIDIDFRLIAASLNAKLHDLRGWRSKAPELYDAGSYEASQPFGAELREAGSWGIVYSSVRLEGGECAGAFRPRALGNATSSGHFALHWDGDRITHWYEKGAPTSTVL